MKLYGFFKMYIKSRANMTQGRQDIQMLQCARWNLESWLSLDLSCKMLQKMQ